MKNNKGLIKTISTWFERQRTWHSRGGDPGDFEKKFDKLIDWEDTLMRGGIAAQTVQAL
jgi:hypothetical protein